MTSLSVNPNEVELTPSFQEAVRIYEEGDRLERYSHGQPIAPSNKSYSFLVFPARDLVFPANFATKIHNHLSRNNLILIGDIVTQSLQAVAEDGYACNGLGVKSQDALRAELEQRMGLNFNLCVIGGWPLDSPERIQKQIFSQADLRYSRENKLQKYLARISPGAA